MAPESPAAKRRADIEPFHFANAIAVRQGADADAAGRASIDFGKKQPALMALIKYGQGIKEYCPIRLSGEAFADEIEKSTRFRVKGITPVLDEQAILIEL